MKFTEFNLNNDLLKGIEKAGYVDCTPVQEKVLETSLQGSDLYVQSQTGTGKTAAYLISIIQELLSRTESLGKKALIMVPTRELAVQVEQEARSLCNATKLTCASFYGGVGYTKQTDQLKKNVDILIGTPGRLIDLHESGSMNLSDVTFLVVDEADRMFDMGFYPDLRKLIQFLPETVNRQTMLFSATLNTYVKNLAWEYTQDAKEIEIATENITVDEIDQELLHVSSDSKIKLLLGIIKNEKPESLIIFCNTKKTCEIISKRLKINGIESEFIIGDLPQSKRLQVLDSFKRGSLNCLVATDVAARGIDVSDLSMVINFDLPNEAENYVHRIGRTARAGKSGKAYTFCSEQDVYNLPAIERYIEKSIPSNMATEEMMIEDKSKDVFIRLSNYHEDSYSDNSKHFDRKSKNGNNHSEKKHFEKQNTKQYKKYDNRKNTFSEKKNYEKRREPQVDLSSYSFDERMKMYKEKYASSSISTPASTQNQTTNNTKKKYSSNKFDKSKANSLAKTKANTKEILKPTKIGLFQRIKIFFGKNK